MTQPPEAGDLQAVERAVRRAALAELICDYLRDGKTWCDEDGMVNGEHSLADAIMELDAPRSQSALSPAPSQGDVELREALRPFAAWGGYVDDHVYGDLPDDAVMYGSIRPADGHRITITALDLRRAARAITAMPVSADRKALLDEGAKVGHEMVPGGFGHGLSHCKNCMATDREIAFALGPTCSKALALSDDDGKEGR